MTRTPDRIWSELASWAERWGLPAPTLSAGWIDLPTSLAPLAKNGWIARSMLEPPVQEEAVALLELETGLRLPEDLRALYGLHDGSFAPLLPCGTSLLRCDAMLTTWRSFAKLADEFAEGAEELVEAGTHHFAAYHRRWLPIAASDDTSILLDFVPGPEGTSGQVLLQISECDYVRVADSAIELLDRWLQLLDANVVRFDADYGNALPAADVPIERLLREAE